MGSPLYSNKLSKHTFHCSNVILFFTKAFLFDSIFSFLQNVLGLPDDSINYSSLSLLYFALAVRHCCLKFVLASLYLFKSSTVLDCLYCFNVLFFSAFKFLHISLNQGLFFEIPVWYVFLQHSPLSSNSFWHFSIIWSIFWVSWFITKWINSCLLSSFGTFKMPILMFISILVFRPEGQIWNPVRRDTKIYVRRILNASRISKTQLNSSTISPS